MKILLTNDDGIEAPGLAALCRVAARFGAATIVAPDRCHSSGSHRVTTVQPITVTDLDAHRFRVEGTPADCARLALTCLAPGSEWLWSGINRGGNLGSDLHVSGTVAAAREAALLGTKAIAISHYVARGRELSWEAALPRAEAVIALIVASDTPAGAFWNVNLPHPEDPAEQPEIVFCEADRSPLPVAFQRTGSEYRYSGDYQTRLRKPGFDVAECFAGKTTATLVYV